MLDLVRDRRARGYGLIRLQNGQIWTLLTTMVELKDHEEKAGYTRPLGARHGVNPGAKTWKELRDEETEQLGIKTQPYVLIIGGGQGGIALGARLRQLGVPTIIVEKNERAGDSWRNRYKSLCLHDPVWYDHLPYIDFPKNWPVFSPKDKIGDWLEMYSKVMELNYWTGTTAKHASWDDAKRNGTSSSSAVAKRSRSSRNSWCLRPACPPSRTCRNSRAWTPSRVSSTIPRAIQVPTATRARRSS
jgi:Predicted flavoprotein involved in K+ transport